VRRGCGQELMDSRHETMLRRAILAQQPTPVA
jgi:hypothetical protein